MYFSARKEAFVSMDGLLSIVVPAYNEEENIQKAADAILAVADSADINCEIVFVSDGSKDATYKKIEEAAMRDSRVRGLEFSRNFGKEAAMFAGLSAGRGDCFVVMDCDLQHPPETIVDMYRLWQEGFEVVEGIKNSRGEESVVYKKFSNLFYSILSKFTGFDMQNTSDFKLLDRKIVDILKALPERKTFFRAMTFWAGFKSCQVVYDVAERTGGESKWSTKALIKYALTNIISFSSAPLDLVTYVGSAALLFSVILGIQTLVRYFSGTAIEGFTTVILLLLIIGGCMLIGLGLLGKYIAAIYDEVKHRPRYIVRLNTDDKSLEDDKK